MGRGSLLNGPSCPPLPPAPRQPNQSRDWTEHVRAVSVSSLADHHQWKSDSKLKIKSLGHFETKSVILSLYSYFIYLFEKGQSSWTKACFLQVSLNETHLKSILRMVQNQIPTTVITATTCMFLLCFYFILSWRGVFVYVFRKCWRSQVYDSKETVNVLFTREKKSK